MSTPDGVRLTETGGNVYSDAQQQTAANDMQLANAVANGLGAPEFTPTDDPDAVKERERLKAQEKERIKAQRKTKLQNVLKQFKINNEDVQGFFKELFNYSIEQLFDSGKISNDKFNDIVNLLSATLTLLANMAENNKGSKSNYYIKDKLNTSISDIKNLFENGYDINKTIHFIENFKNMGFFDILKIHHPELKNYKSLKEVPNDIINGIVKTFLDKFAVHNGTNDDYDIGESYQIFSNLIGRTTPEEAEILMNAFLTIAEGNEKFEGIKRSIKMLKEKPETLEALLNDETLKNVFITLGLNQAEIIEFLEELFNTGLNPKVIAEKIGNYIEPLTQKYNALKNKENLTEDEQNFIAMYEKIKNGSILTAIQFLLEKITVIGEEQGKRLLNCAQDGGIYEELMNNLAEFFNQNPDKDSKELLDLLTDNKFSETCTRQAEMNPPVTNPQETQDFGFSQRGNYNPYQSNLNGSDFGITYNNAEPQYTLYPTLSNDSAFSSQTAIGALSFKELDDLVNNGKIAMSKILKECKSTLNNAIGQVTLNFMNQLHSISEQSYNLGLIGSNIAKKTVIKECNYDYNKLASRVDLTVNIKQQLEEDAKQEEILKFSDERPELT